MPIRTTSSPTPSPSPTTTPPAAPTPTPAATTTTPATMPMPMPMTAATTPTTTPATMPVDSFESAPSGAPTVAPQGEGRGGLPPTLLETANARVVHGDDPGDFYCEHAFFTAQQAAEAPGSQVAKNAQGERLVGFLHVPRDAAAGDETPTADHATRHLANREVVGAALRGFVEEATPAAGTGPVRVLLTGYQQWGSVKNNPTADFTSRRDNVDAAMAQAFGRNLVGAEGRRVGGDDHSDIWSYRIRDAATGRQREVQIQATPLPVDDGAIDGGPRSLQEAMRGFSPHAVLSMGVHGGASFVAEHHADDGNLTLVDGKQTHGDGTPARTNLPDNFALPRAILRGGQPQPISVVDLETRPADRSLAAFAARRSGARPA